MLMQLEIPLPEQISEIELQNIVELIRSGNADIKVQDGKLIITRKQFRDGILGIKERVYLVDPEKVDIPKEFDKYSTFEDDLRRKVFEHSCKNLEIVMPIVISPNARGRFTVIEGIQRVLLARKEGLPLPAIIKHISGSLAIAYRLALNLGRRIPELDEMGYLIKQLIEKNPSLARNIGISTSDAYSLGYLDRVDKETKKEIDRIYKPRPLDVVAEVVKVATVNKEKAKELAKIVKREDIRDKKSLEVAKEKVNRMKVGVRCAICGKLLNDDEKNWLPVCSADRWILQEEFNIWDKRIKCMLCGHYGEPNEMVIIHRKHIEELPEEIRVKYGFQKLLEE